MYKLLIAVLMVVALSSSASGGTLFVGLEGSTPPVHSSDLAGFPSVTWESHYSFDVSGAAATPDGELYLCNDSFTTELYGATLEETPTHLSTISEDMHALAYGRSTLYGFSNYASTKGIYSIDPPLLDQHRYRRDVEGGGHDPCQQRTGPRSCGRRQHGLSDRDAR
jgi:hypothetical protein